MGEVGGEFDYIYDENGNLIHCFMSDTTHFTPEECSKGRMDKRIKYSKLVYRNNKSETYTRKTHYRVDGTIESDILRKDGSIILGSRVYFHSGLSELTPLDEGIITEINTDDNRPYVVVMDKYIGTDIKIKTRLSEIRLVSERETK
jgi:hypothetical protein